MDLQQGTALGGQVYANSFQNFTIQKQQSGGVDAVYYIII
jgi:hypothetical protein